MGIKVYVLSGGILDADRSVIHPGDDSRRRITLPVPQILIQSDGRNILVDTGCPVVAAGDDDALQREFGMDPSWIRPRIGPGERPDRQLAMLGLTPDDLDLVINTHMHFDHAGGNALFAGVPLAVQETELNAVREVPGDHLWDAPGLQFQTQREDWSPTPGVEMLFTPGHTPGHQSMLVRLQPRPWLFTWDAVYTEEHWREDKLGVVFDPVIARQSIERLRQIAEDENARIIFGHDVSQWRSLGLEHEPVLLAEG